MAVAAARGAATEMDPCGHHGGEHPPGSGGGLRRGMIPHHQGAIEMAQIVLKYGKDEEIRKLANAIIREQRREIAEMQEWLKTKER